MYYIKFLLFVVSAAIFIGMTLFFQESSNHLIFMAFAIDDSDVTLVLKSSNFQNQEPDKIDNTSTKLIQEQQLGQKLDNCPPKPSPSTRDLRNFNTTIDQQNEPRPPIRITVPTIANTGSSLLIDGTGFIPFEKVRIELSIDWSSTSSEFPNKTLIQCQTVATNSYGSFTTTLDLPEAPLHTIGSGKYSIIGMESREEKIALGTFISSKTKIYARQ